MAEDLSWTESGIQSKVSGYYISEPDYNRTINTILFTVIFGTGIYADSLSCALYSVYFLSGTLAVLSGSRPVWQSEEAARAGGRRTCNTSSLAPRIVYHRTLFY